MLQVLRSFHSEMSATLHVEGITVETFSVSNGLRQGCMAPVLFNIFMWAIVVKWPGAVKDIPGIGFEFKTHNGDCNLYWKTRHADPIVVVTDFLIRR